MLDSPATSSSKRRRNCATKLSLLKQRVFGGGPDNCSPNVVAIKAA